MTSQFRTLPVFGSDQRSVAEIVNGIMNGNFLMQQRLTLRLMDVLATIQTKLHLVLVLLLLLFLTQLRKAMVFTYQTLQE